MFTTRQPEIREKRNKGGSMLIRLTRSIDELNYAEEFAVSGGDGHSMIQIERASWADWIFEEISVCRDGRIFESRVCESTVLSARELIDLNSAKPLAVRSPIGRLDGERCKTANDAHPAL